MSVAPGDVRRMAELARLHLDDDEVERFVTDLNGILDHVEALTRMEAPGPDDVDRPGPAPLATRPTEEGEPDALGAGPGAIAPGFQDGFFVVPPPPGVHGTGEGS